MTPPSGPPTTSTWDANGNLALQNTGGALTTYSWDPENRLLTVSDSTGITTASYSADGLRQKKVVGAATTNFLWDEQNVLQERDGALAKTAQCTDWPGFWGGLASQRRGAASSFCGFDSQASTRVLVAIGGEVTDSYSFKAFGEELAAGSGTVNPFRYAGRFGYFRDLANRAYVRARHCDIIAGRWGSRDPIGFAGGDSNLYRVTRNLGTSRADPSGLDSIGGCCTAGAVDQYFNVTLRNVCPTGWEKFNPDRDRTNCTKQLIDYGDPKNADQARKACKKVADYITGWAGPSCALINEGSDGGLGTVWAAAYCCCEKNVYHPCATRTCPGNPDYPSDPCMLECLWIHENSHLVTCDGVTGLRPYGGCAYAVQVDCLALKYGYLCRNILKMKEWKEGSDLDTALRKCRMESRTNPCTKSSFLPYLPGEFPFPPLLF